MNLDTQDELDRLLKEAGASRGALETYELIAAVTAAPGDDGGMGAPDFWLSLVAPRMTAALEKSVTALKADIESQSNNATVADKSQSAARLKALRLELSGGNIDGFVIPLADEYQGEYIPKRAQRLAWLTGFTGSAGVAVVLGDRAALFTDGRYTLQAREQVDVALFEMCHITELPPDQWISEHLLSGGRLGFDPWLHTGDGAERLRRVCDRKNGELVAVTPNPIDVIWTDQPPAPVSPVVAHDIEYAGKSSTEKLGEIAAELTANGQDAVVLTAPPSIAWLANLRGGDVPYTPLPLGFAIVNCDAEMIVFMDQRKLGAAADELTGANISFAEISEFVPALEALGAAGKSVRIDSAGTAEAVSDKLKISGAIVVGGNDPCAHPKACKNAAEIEGARAAHRRDGAALTRFLAWLAKTAGGGQLTEISAAEKLELFRRENDLIQGLSFPTISGAGPNGAIVHYRVSQSSNRPLEPNSLYLVDSGAQYLDGTTDVTRTVAIGTPTPEMKDRFTRVLKGHIALARARFPRGTSGSQLDVLARSPLWEIGLDYDHGTGHGVGSFLGVHEGPQRISKMPSRVPLEAGMIVSDEPGYYKTGEYGIRIENLVLVVDSERAEASERETLEFETLTLAPIDRNLIERSLLTATEVDWLDSYHRRVRDTISPLVDDDTAQWLVAATEPLGA